MACSAANVLSFCKCPSFHNTLKLLYYSSQCFWLSPPKHTACHVLRTRARGISAKLSSTDSKQSPQKTVNLRTRRETVSGSSWRGKVERKTVEEENNDKRFRKDSRESRKELGAGKRREMCTRSSFAKVRDIMNGQVDGRGKKGGDAEVGKEKTRGGLKKNKSDPRVMDLRGRLDMCSKRGDVIGAIEVYDLAHREGIEMEQYHYTVLLYLCSSAATGVVQPAKSGSGARTLNAINVPNESSRLGFSGLSELRKELNGNHGAAEMDFQVSHSVQKLVHHGQGSGVVGDKEVNHCRVCSDLDGARNGKGNLAQISDENGRPNYQHLGNDSNNHDDCEIQISEDFKKYALKRGFEIYEKMLIDKVPMNEATLTTVARMALSMGNGDMAFDMVKQMKPLGINPRLRSYGPALSAFCSSGDIDKAFAVEKHMLDHGVDPEEPELEALLRVSVEAAKDDKVYYLLHKLRASTRKVSPCTADVIVRWFKSKAASRIGKRKWDHRFIKEAIETRGGGWHGQGWLGSGKWNLSYASIGPDGLCKCCGEKLAIIDLDPKETENFAESVASIAVKRERDSRFQKFQKWLDYYGPFEAVVDGANVGLFSQKRFTPSRVNAVVNGIRHKLPSKKWPLIVLHNRRITGNKMDEPVNKMLIEKWKNADALYATPTGSNDDWYWLYAAIKFKCLIVTNDEMRDHTFQLLGNDFFPKWKERHQVRFSFSDVGPVFHMPPPYSIVIQESEEGHWHIPIATDYDQETDRAWLCIVRDNSKVGVKYSTASRTEGSQLIDLTVRQATPTTQTEVTVNSDEVIHNDDENVSNSPQEVYKNLRNILSASVFQDHCTLLSKIEAAEKRGNYVIDFDI